MNQTGRTSRRGWMAVALLAAAMLYVLSFGPAVWLADRDLVNRDGVARLHLPLLRLCFVLPYQVDWVVRARDSVYEE